MAKTTTRKSRPPKLNARLRYAMRTEKQELARSLRNERAVSRLTRQLAHAVRKSEYDLRDLTRFLATQCGFALHEPTRTPAPAPRAAEPNPFDDLAPASEAAAFEKV